MNRAEPATENSVITKNGRKSTLLTLLAILLILATAIAAGAYLIKSTPKANRQKPLKLAPLVTTKPIESQLQQVRISAMGTVIPASELNLRSEVSGRIIAINKGFALGGRVNSGDQLLMLEPADYQLAVAQAQSTVATAAYALAIEEGNQEIARQEWQLYDGKETASDQDRNLALRMPHLLKAQAELHAAQAGQAQAEINLKRTVIYASFNANIVRKSAEPGGYLTAQDSIATLVSTDHYWVQVSIPVDRLVWLDIPQQQGEQGSMVEITTSGGKRKLGSVDKLLADLEENGRMARLLVKVNDPLDLNNPAEQRQPLLLGEYVRVEIDGQLLSDVISIPRSALHDGNNVWLADNQQRLQVTAAEVVWRDSETVYLKNNLPAAGQLVLSNLSTAADGMQLRVEEPRLALQEQAQPQEISHD